MSPPAASEHFTVRSVAPGVHALIVKRQGTAAGNSAVVDLGDRTLVVGTFQTLEAADDLLDATYALTGRRAAIVVNTHWHDDHTTGNQLLEGADIIATRRTVELVSANAAPDRAALAAEIEEYLVSPDGAWTRPPPRRNGSAPGAGSGWRAPCSATSPASASPSRTACSTTTWCWRERAVAPRC